MSTSVVLGDHLDILVPFFAILVSVLDAHVREVHLVVEVREPMFAGPLADLFLAPIGMAVVVGAVVIALVQPSLVFALELVVEDDALDVRPSAFQAARGVLVCAIDLQVMLPFALALKAIPERLTATFVAVTMMFKQTAAFFGQRHRMVTRTRDSGRLDQPLVPEMSQVAQPRIGRTVVMVTQITTGDHPKRADRRERARLGAAQRVLVAAVAHEFAIETPRQIEIAGERLACVDGSASRFAVARRGVSVGPVAAVFSVLRWPRVAGTAAETGRVVSVARAVLSIDGIKLAIGRESIVVASIGIAWIEVHRSSFGREEKSDRRALAESETSARRPTLPINFHVTNMGQSGAVSGGRRLLPDQK